MKKILTFCVITVAILLSSCKDKTITTDYTIGCIGYYSVDPASDWVGFEEYMQSVADYNMVVHFTNKTLAENDAQALASIDIYCCNITCFWIACRICSVSCTDIKNIILYECISYSLSSI